MISDRINFGQLQDGIDIPDLIEIQIKSYHDFLQMGVPAAERQHQGLQEVLSEAFPARDSSETGGSIEFVSYEIGLPKLGIVECLKDGETFEAPLAVTFRLTNTARKEVREEKIFMGDIPMMTERGSFIFNGAERVIVTQLHRSPGVCFEGQRHASGKTLFSYKIIADHGSWLEVQFDLNDYMYIYLDRKRRRRKFLISTFMRAFGFADGNHEILNAVYGVEEVRVSALMKEDDPSHIFTVNAIKTTIKSDAGESLEVELVPALESLNDNILEQLKQAKISKIAVVRTRGIGDYFIKCLAHRDSVGVDRCIDAQREIYHRMRPSEPITDNNARALFKRLFEDVRRYDLGYVGRFKMNQRLGINVDANVRVLTKSDLAMSTRILMQLRYNNGLGAEGVDDIDHLGRRRLRTVGELVQNQCRLGLNRTATFVRERLNDPKYLEAKSLQTLISSKYLSGQIRDFFGRNQLSQFMDQTNCLAELTNKRRLSALGPGGLVRDRAGYDVRDVHSSHYGRVCPIETPEGPNIGLISSLALFGKVDKHGFIMTPYCTVKDSTVSSEIVYLTADAEEKYVIAQANALRDEQGRFTSEYVWARHKGENGEFEPSKVQLIDVSPKQLVSAAAGLIPFLEHDDANRALMGANMQRQAVPLLKPERPLVGTGLEHIVARDSRAIVVAREAGIVASANGERIIVTRDGKMPSATASASSHEVYHLYKFLRSNASTFVNQHPTVKAGQAVVKGETLADGACTDQGDLALGRNVLVAFMPWCGYNFEDAIIISERLVQEDVYTSIHVSLEQIKARDTKLGPEEITRDIPQVGEAMLRNLDSEGVVRIGAEVKPGDILVGKITPKTESDLAPEERLLKAIFGEKSSDVKDTSLLVPTGCAGIVMDVRVSRKPDPAQLKLSQQEQKVRLKEVMDKYQDLRNSIISDMVRDLSDAFLGGKLPVSVTRTEEGSTVEIIQADRKITKKMLNTLADSFDSYQMKECEERDRIEEIIKPYRTKLRDNDRCREDDLNLLAQNDGGVPGKIEQVLVYVASKRRISIGDKMAGRHGNKGIVAKIVPAADLPFMADGTPVDIILSPLGVPSRMNVGQVFETHAGWAAKILGMNVATPVFDGIQESAILKLLEDARAVKVKERGWTLSPAGRVIDHNGSDRTDDFVGRDGKARLYDGRTGEAFAQHVVVGQIYMLKLDHLVVNKIHARAVGPYSLVTQQPLGGKAQHGGQRFGEMEVWALEAYGAAHTLQEMLTVKSDDVFGRKQIYEAIVNGKANASPGIPESFNVLKREMMSLCLNVQVHLNKNVLA